MMTLERQNHHFTFEETLKTRLQASGTSIPKTLQFNTYLFDDNRLSINGLAVVHGRRNIDRGNIQSAVSAAAVRREAPGASGLIIDHTGS